jgi:hypothetical protein
MCQGIQKVFETGDDSSEVSPVLESRRSKKTHTADQCLSCWTSYRRSTLPQHEFTNFGSA